MNFTAVIKMVARMHSVREDEVLREMQTAIEVALKSAEPAAQTHWSRISQKGDTPTPEEVVAYLVQQVMQDNCEESF